MPIRLLVIVCSCSAVAKAEPVLHRAHIRDCLAVPNCRLSFLGSVWEAVVLAKLGVSKQVSRSVTIPKDEVICSSTDYNPRCMCRNANGQQVEQVHCGKCVWESSSNSALILRAWESQGKIQPLLKGSMFQLCQHHIV